MMVGMVSDLMTLGDDLAEDPRVSFNAIAQHKKGRFHLVLAQNVQNFKRKDWMGAIIKCDRDLLGACRAGIDDLEMGLG